MPAETTIWSSTREFRGRSGHHVNDDVLDSDRYSRAKHALPHASPPEARPVQHEEPTHHREGRGSFIRNGPAGGFLSRACLADQLWISPGAAGSFGQVSEGGSGKDLDGRVSDLFPYETQ